MIFLRVYLYRGNVWQGLRTWVSMAGLQLGRVASRVLSRCSASTKAAADLARECGPCAATAGRRWFAAQPQPAEGEGQFAILEFPQEFCLYSPPFRSSKPILTPLHGLNSRELCCPCCRGSPQDSTSLWSRASPKSNCSLNLDCRGGEFSVTVHLNIRLFHLLG